MIDSFSLFDNQCMRRALELAAYAKTLGEVPVGAVITKDGQIICEGWNLRETKNDPLLHAEIMAIQSAAKHLNSWRLSGTTLYVTLEPCLMCAGTIYQARVSTVVFGAFDPKAGALGSLYKIHEDTRLNHRFLVQNGLLAQDCSDLLKQFFRARRMSKVPTEDT